MNEADEENRSFSRLVRGRIRWLRLPYGKLFMYTSIDLGPSELG
jgi:hypothetical protein